MSEIEILRAAFKTAYLNKEHRFQPDMCRYGELGEYKDSTLESEFETFCDGVKYALAAQRDEGLAREAELKEQRNRSARLAIVKSQLAKQRLVEIDALQQRLAEAETLLRSLESSWNDHSGRARHSETMNEVEDYLASAGCADGEKS